MMPQQQTAASPQIQQIKNMMRMVQMSNNKSATLQTLIAQNPGLKNIINLVNSKGMSMEQVFYALAQQRGIDPQVILNELNS